MILRIFNILPA